MSVRKTGMGPTIRPSLEACKIREYTRGNQIDYH